MKADKVVHKFNSNSRFQEAVLSQNQLKHNGIVSTIQLHYRILLLMLSVFWNQIINVG